MKKGALISGIAMIVLAGPVLAQTAPSTQAPPPMPAAPMPEAQTTTPATGMDPDLMNMKIGTLEGMNVQGAEGQDIGEVERIVRGAQGLMAVVEAGSGFLGFGTRAVLVPIGQFHVVGDHLMLPMTEDEARSMVEYEVGREGYAEIEDEDLMLSDALASR